MGHAKTANALATGGDLRIYALFELVSGPQMASQVSQMLRQVLLLEKRVPDARAEMGHMAKGVPDHADKDEMHAGTKRVQ